MSKIWKVKAKIPIDSAVGVDEYPELVKQLLFNRGLVDIESAKDFLQTSYEKLHSPFLFQDMQKAVDRIWMALENNEKICIYGDYDADAVTANAVLRQAFRYLNYDKVESYIPDRFTEGYGVNLEALAKIKSEGVKVIITVDCGTNSCDAAEFCAREDIDLIITDHHEIIGELPKAYALINPKNPADNYPFREIVGVGVAFKLVCGILADGARVGASFSRPKSESGRLKAAPTTPIKGYEKWLLDLVAIGTVADCHALRGENRIFVKFGLKVLAKTKWIGLRALMATAGVQPEKKNLDTYSLGFVIAPSVNAAGRLEHANVALDLLLEEDLNMATEKALKLEEINKRRQQLTATVISEAKEQVAKIQNRKILLLMGDNWPKGVVGLVAGRLAEEFYKPVIVLEKTNGFCTGSARTAGEFDILEAIKYASAYTVKFGGHKQAAGLTIKAEEFENFYGKLLEYAELNISEESAQKILELEAELDASQLSIVTCQLLQQLEPFGVGNPKPKFLVSQVNITSSRTVGAEGKHTQYQLKKEDRVIAGIAFNSAVLEKNFKVGDTIDVACELIEDGWNGRMEVKLRVIDMRVHPNVLTS